MVTRELFIWIKIVVSNPFREGIKDIFMKEISSSNFFCAVTHIQCTNKIDIMLKCRIIGRVSTLKNIIIKLYVRYVFL